MLQIDVGMTALIGLNAFSKVPTLLLVLEVACPGGHPPSPSVAPSRFPTPASTMLAAAIMPRTLPLEVEQWDRDPKHESRLYCPRTALDDARCILP